MATYTLRCGDPQCEHSTAQGEWSAADYDACRDHLRASHHSFGGAFRDGELWASEMKGVKLKIMNEGGLPRPETVAAGGAVPPQGPAGAPPAMGGSDDDGGDADFPDDDGLEDDEEGGPQGPDPYAQGAPQTPRGRRPTLLGAYRAYTPYPVLMLNEALGIYFRGFVLRMAVRAEDGDPDVFDLGKPVNEAMADYLLMCAQAHQRDHPEQYDMGSLIEEPRMRALDERERVLSQREAQVRDLWRRTMETAATLNAQMAELSTQKGAG